MRLNRLTLLWITAEDGTSTMTLEGLINAVKGGTNLDEIEITTDKTEGEANEKKRSAIACMVNTMRQMTPTQADAAVDLVRSKDSLMDLHGDNA